MPAYGPSLHPTKKEEKRATVDYRITTKQETKTKGDPFMFPSRADPIIALVDRGAHVRNDH